MSQAISRTMGVASTSGRGQLLASPAARDHHRPFTRVMHSAVPCSSNGFRTCARNITSARAAKGGSGVAGSSSSSSISSGVGFSNRNAAKTQQPAKAAAANATATQAPPASKAAATASADSEAEAEGQHSQDAAREAVQDIRDREAAELQNPASGLMGVRPQAEGTTSSSVGDIYNRPELYDIAFSYRAFKEELAFLKAAYTQHASEGSKLQSVLELGCGPARHSIGLARGGVQQVTAVDLNASMLEYAKGKATSANVPPQRITFLQGDMSNLGDRLQGRHHDMVLCLLGTFSHMLDNAAASRCFGEVARHLAPHGIFVLELAHPGDLFDGTFILGDGGKEVWEVPAGPGKKVLVEWGAEFDNFDPVTQVMQRTVSINVFKGDELQEGLEEVVPYRQFTVQEIDLLATAHGLKIAGLYGEMNLEVDLNHEEAYRMVMVLKHT